MILIRKTDEELIYDCHSHCRRRKARSLIRSGMHKGHTAGMAPGYVQGNLAILPKSYAAEFLQFCHFNPKPCPLIGMTEPGDPSVPMLGNNIDLRTDLPKYRVRRDGQLIEEVNDLSALWGTIWSVSSSAAPFSFEQALLEAGIPLPHIESGRSVVMYQTNIACTPAGRFHGPVTVSMRSMTPANAIRAIQICTRFPNVHGAPIHFGDPEGYRHY